MISMIINQVLPINLEVTSEIMYLHPTSTIPIFTHYYGILCQVWESTYISNVDNDLKYRSKYPSSPQRPNRYYSLCFGFTNDKNLTYSVLSIDNMNPSRELILMKRELIYNMYGIG